MDELNAPSEEARMPRILRDLAEGRLDDSEVGAVVDWLQASPDVPPPWLVSRAVRIGRLAAEVRPSRPTQLRRLLAALVWDSRLQPRLAGARAVDSDPPRLVYRAGQVEIDLEAIADAPDGRLRLLGQVTADSAALIKAWVVAEGASGRAEADLDELGQFALGGLRPGQYRLQVGLARELIEIRDLQL